MGMLTVCAGPAHYSFFLWHDCSLRLLLYRNTYRDEPSLLRAQLHTVRPLLYPDVSYKLIEFLSCC